LARYLSYCFETQSNALQALTIACLDDVHYREVRKSISGISFLSTPHRGSAIASLGLLPMQLVKLANIPVSGFAGNMRTDLVQGLGRDSESLTEITKNFRNQMVNIKVASFIETAITRPANTVVSTRAWHELNFGITTDL
jgi:ankyrin repeat domain-containing protein 50